MFKKGYLFMLAHIRRAVSRTSRRRSKPVEPAPPLRSPATKFTLDMQDATDRLAKAVRAYATAPDDIPASIRADYAAGLALGDFVKLLVVIQAEIDPANVLMQEREERVLDNLIVNYGVQALLSNAVDLAELRGDAPQPAVYERAAELAACVHDSAHLALVD